MLTGESHWTLGTLVWLPICAVLTVAFVLLAKRLRRYWHEHRDYTYDDGTEALVLSWVCWFVAVALVVGTALGMYPYHATHHKWNVVSGTVETVDSRLISGDGSTERFVIVFKDGLTTSCDDTRCASVEPGDEVTLSCKKEFQYQATDGWGCNWRSDGAK